MLQIIQLIRLCFIILFVASPLYASDSELKNVRTKRQVVFDSESEENPTGHLLEPNSVFAAAAGNDNGINEGKNSQSDKGVNFGGRPGNKHGGPPNREGDSKETFFVPPGQLRKQGGGSQEGVFFPPGQRKKRPFVPLTRKPRPLCSQRPNAANCIATPPPSPGALPQNIPQSIRDTALGKHIDASDKLVIPGVAIGSSENRSYFLGFNQPDRAYLKCFTPLGFRGRCRFLKYCARPEITSDFDTYLQYACPIGNGFLGVCCPNNLSAAFQNGVPQTTTTTATTTTTTTRPAVEVTPPPKTGCGINENQIMKRIVGGKEADPTEYPWMAALLRDEDDQYCGGVLITDRHVLTASHCVVRRKPSEIVVRLGEYDFSDNASARQDFPVEKIIMHEQYNAISQANDIALLKLEKSTAFNQFIWPICLPSPTFDATDTIATVTGWGTVGFAGVGSSVLKEVNVPVWKLADCKAAYSQPVTDFQLCAGHKTADNLGDSCQGDSGGPLQLQLPSVRWSVIGVVSWAIGCSEKKHPGVYTKVTAYLDWIKDNASNFVASTSFVNTPYHI